MLPSIISVRNLAISISCVALSTPLLFGVDLSTYRGFQLGMNLPAVGKLADTKPAETKMIHQRPAVIEELEWRPRRFPGVPPETDPVKDVIFGFYNGQLFRMVVNYDRYRTEGLTTEDMIEAISTTYGPAAQPDAEVLEEAFEEHWKRWVGAEEEEDQSPRSATRGSTRVARRAGR